MNPEALTAFTCLQQCLLFLFLSFFLKNWLTLAPSLKKTLLLAEWNKPTVRRPEAVQTQKNVARHKSDIAVLPVKNPSWSLQMFPLCCNYLLASHVARCWADVCLDVCVFLLLHCKCSPHFEKNWWYFWIVRSPYIWFLYVDKIR